MADDDKKLPGQSDDNIDSGVKNEDTEGGKKSNDDIPFTEQFNNVKDNSRKEVKDAFGVSKEEILEELDKAKDIEKLVNLFAKWTDIYGHEAILSRIPLLGDIGPALVSTCFLFYQGRKIGLGRKEMLKIFKYQSADFLLGAIPFVGNIVDFFFEGNVYSAKVFSDHVEKLKMIAVQKGATLEEINGISIIEAETLKKMEEQIAKKRKKN